MNTTSIVVVVGIVALIVLGVLYMYRNKKDSNYTPASGGGGAGNMDGNETEGDDSGGLSDKPRGPKFE